jgi:hypothetical protein
VPVLVDHGDATWRAIGREWLAVPRLVVELDPELLAAWLEGDRELSARLARVLRERGLALFGAETLRRIAARGQPPARDIAAAWLARLDEPARRPR